MTAAFLFLRGIPILVWPLILVSGLWLAARHEVSSLKRQEVVAQAQRDRAVTEANQRASQAAFKYEEWKTRQEPRKIYVTRKVKDANAADPVWSSASLPSSVRDAISAAASSVDSGQPDSAVRKADSGSTDERGTTGSLRVGSGFLGRLFSPSSGASASSEK